MFDFKHDVLFMKFCVNFMPDAVGLKSSKKLNFSLDSAQNVFPVVLGDNYFHQLGLDRFLPCINEIIKKEEIRKWVNTFSHLCRYTHGMHLNLGSIIVVEMSG